MQLFTERTVDILMDVCAWTFLLTAVSILIALTFDAVEDLLDRARRAADRHRQARRLTPTRAWKVQRGAVAVEFGILLPFLLLIILGGALLNLAITDHGRLVNACQTGARAGATVLLKIDSFGEIVRDEAGAVQLARQVYLSNAPMGSSDPIITISGAQLEVAGTKSEDFMGFIEPVTMGARAVAVAEPWKGGAL